MGKLILLSGIEYKTESTEIVYIQLEQTDETTIENIKNAGSDKSKYKFDIITLYKKYIDPTAYICTRCSSEIILAMNKLLFYYEKNKHLHLCDTTNYTN